jgi:hypothetical protein
MALNKIAGIISNNDFESECATALSYLHILIGLDGSVSKPTGSYQNASRFLMPKGFLNTHFKPGVSIVSNKLGGSKNSRIECTSTILLRQKLGGMDIFNAMLTSLGTNANRASPSPLDDVHAARSWSSDRKRKHNHENRNRNNNYAHTESRVDRRSAITYPKLFMDMLKEALHLFFSSNVQYHICVTNAYFLFNSTLEKTIESGILDTDNLDLKYTSDEKPKGLRMEFQKVLQEICNEKKRTNNHTSNSIWFLKEDNRTFEEKGVENSIQDFLIDIADKVVTKHVAANGKKSLGDVQNKTGTQCVNSNDKKEWTFTQPDLKGEKGWTMQRRSNNQKQYFSPEGIRYLSIPQVRQYFVHIAAVKDGTAIATKRKRKCKTKNNNERVAHKFTQEDLKHLDGWSRQERNKGYQYITPKGKVVSSLKKVRKHDEYKPKSTKRS